MEALKWLFMIACLASFAFSCFVVGVNGVSFMNVLALLINTLNVAFFVRVL